MRANELAPALCALEAAHRRRRRPCLESAQGARVVVDGQPLLAFASNDYLGLAAHPYLADAAQAAIGRFGVGAGASHLVCGHGTLHEEAERRLAAWTGCPRALLFGSGYAANLAVITSLLGRDDEVFADRLVHASLNDGCQLSRARFTRFPHNDLARLAAQLAASRARSKMIVVDAVYSMDGDEAPLPALLALAQQHDAWLFVDDAHGFGLTGGGRGALAEHALADERIIYMGTLGKAAGVAGAFVAGSETLIEWLVNRGRSYIYTTALPPALAAATLAALDVMASEPWRRERVFAHARAVQAAGLAWPMPQVRLAIHPVIIGGDAETLAVSQALREQGIWVPPIRPPTVPAGQARLRISLSAAHEDGDVAQLLAALGQLAPCMDPNERGA